MLTEEEGRARNERELDEIAARSGVDTTTSAWRELKRSIMNPSREDVAAFVRDVLELGFLKCH